ncbi:hypothetical protein HWN40_05800 [Methanolobus zinderi]|uniref:Uncharacterized protein n=1 Tax=Methanolobus zinderi TaxID=536044 RepID=A0A7D5E6A4_9EURY|nr:hypothetical protein [Methanolobus zinderi]QLC49792.1 hypothetical protein HWN40_05800 [Methanolobus zinderi]
MIPRSEKPMFYGEMDFYGIAGIPQISTMYYIDSSKWNAWRVRLTDRNIEIIAGTEVIRILLEQIEFIDRPLSHAVANKIQNYTKHGSFLVVDYKQKATIGHGNALFSLVLAGKKEDVSTLKHLLMRLLGLKADPVIGNLQPEEIRLLCLFATGMDSSTVILPLFNNDTALLQRTFNSLKRKDMVDDYASLTSSGMDVVEKIRDSGKVKLGTDIDNKFNELSSNWTFREDIPANTIANKILWKHENSSLSGFVQTEDIWKYLNVDNIGMAELKKLHISGLGLLMHTLDGSTVFLLSHDSSVVLALYGILNKTEDIQMRILFMFFLGFENERNLLGYIGLNDSGFEDHCYQMIQKGILDEKRKSITKKGLDLLYRKLMGDVSVLLEHDRVDRQLGEFSRLDRMKRSSAKKRVMQALQHKHMQMGNF